MRLRPGWLLAVAGFAAAACSGGGGGSNSFQNVSGPHVVIQDFSFTPQSITIKAGQSVTWTNSGPSVHDVTSDTMVFESGNLSVGGEGNPYGGSTQGGVFSFTFNTAGTYNYHCMLHPPSQYPGFTGTVVVTP
jgi:plastocyanin